MTAPLPPIVPPGDEAGFEFEVVTTTDETAAYTIKACGTNDGCAGTCASACASRS